MKPIVLNDALSGVDFLLESDNPAPHRMALRLAGLKAGPYTVTAGPKPCVTFSAQEGQENTVELPSVSNGQLISIRPDGNP